MQIAQRPALQWPAARVADYSDKKLDRASCIHSAGKTPTSTVSTAETTIVGLGLTK